MEKEIVRKEEINGLFKNLIEIARHDVKDKPDFDEALLKRLNFKPPNQLNKYIASVDLLNDTEYAIMSAFRFQLGDKSKTGDWGEEYLRLYGILNAVYLQMSAFEMIATLLNFPNVKGIKSGFTELEIYTLRNIAGSHTVNLRYFKEDIGTNATDSVISFRIMQCYLEKTGSNIQALDENNTFHEFNLLKALTEYEKIARDLLVQLIHHIINHLVRRKHQKKALTERLNDLLPNLIDYSTIDENKMYYENLINRTKSGLSKVKV